MAGVALFLSVLLLFLGSAWAQLGGASIKELTRVTGDMFCVGFGPYIAGFTPKPPKIEPPWELIAILLDAITTTNRIKCIWLYGALGANAMTVGLANQRGLAVVQGIYIDFTLSTDQNREEIQAGIWLARHYPETIKALICGNEVRMRASVGNDRGWETANDLVLACLQQAREAGVIQPLSTQASWFEWCDENFPGQHFPTCAVWNPVAAAVDFVAANIYGWWTSRANTMFGCIPPEQVPEWTVGRLTKLMETYEPIGKAVIAAEIGWPGPPNTYRDDYGGAPCSVANKEIQRNVIAQTFSYCRSMQLGCVLFEAHSEPWKAAEEGLDFGGHWGFGSEENPGQTIDFPWFPDTPPPAWYVPAPSASPAPANPSASVSPSETPAPYEPSFLSSFLVSPLPSSSTGGKGAGEAVSTAEAAAPSPFLWLALFTTLAGLALLSELGLVGRTAPVCN